MRSRVWRLEAIFLMAKGGFIDLVISMRSGRRYMPLNGTSVSIVGLLVNLTMRTGGYLHSPGCDRTAAIL